MSTRRPHLARRRPAVIAAAAAAALLAGASPAVAQAAGARAVSSGTWGTAREVPGLAALNQHGDAQISSVSCASAGNCSAGGFYDGSEGHVASSQAFVVSQVNGTWHTAIKVPGLAVLNQGGVAAITSVSCGSAGNCSAGGYYRDSSGGQQVFVVSEVNGVWGMAEEVAAALNTAGNAKITSVSCASAGNCSAGGYYFGSSGNQAFVVSQVNGTWHAAIKVPGTAALNQGGGADIDSVSCASAGNCSAGGAYIDSSNRVQVFVVSQVHGTWHIAIEVPGTAALNTGGDAKITSVSCASAGTCSAGGQYIDSSFNYHVFVVSQVNGTWHAAIKVPGTAALNQGGAAAIQSVSCASPGNCIAAGTYADSSSRQQAFVAGQVNGAWHTAIEVPGTAALNTGGDANITSVSCTTPGNCSAGGFYTESSFDQQAFVVGQVNGAWHTAIKVPGSAALNQGGYAAILSVSCTSPGKCSAGGYYQVSSLSNLQAFVDSET
jgi:hypothetical protein